MTISDHAAQVRTKKIHDALSRGIDDRFVSRLVEDFYEAVRRDDRLGPIFAKHVKDWPLHLARMKDFWASIMIESGRFSGSPMQKHIAIGRLSVADFSHWQLLWNQTLTQLAPNSSVGDTFRDAARRIGESLLLGVQIDRGELPAAFARSSS